MPSIEDRAAAFARTIWDYDGDPRKAADWGKAVTRLLVEFANIETAALQKPTLYWDDRDVEEAYESLEELASECHVGEIIDVCSFHTLPTIRIRVLGDGDGGITYELLDDEVQNDPRR